MPKNLNKKVTNAHIFVSGKVQGVGFRWFTKNLAKKLNIKGWVKNLEDGRVEIWGYSEDEDELRIFVDNLRKGSMLSVVEDVDVNWNDLKNEYKKFEIR